MARRSQTMDFAYRPARPQGKRRNRKRRDLNVTIRRWCVVVGCVEILVFLLAYPGFRVKNVRIEGLHTLSSSQVFAAAHVRAGSNVLVAALHDPLVRGIERIPAVDHASRMLELPNTLVLRVTERTPVAVLQTSGGYWLLDQKRVPYQVADGPVNGLPTIQATGDAALADVKIGRPLGYDWVVQTYYLLSLLSNKENLQPKLITVDQNANMCLNRQDNLLINIGTPDNLPAKLSIADDTVRAGGTDVATKLAYIDVTCPTQPALMPRKGYVQGHA